jgi:UDP-N-acetylmuramoyl-tripeptide--D-alanyl-D-alanine ligase
MRAAFKKIIATVLRLEARLVIRKYKPNIVAITGSVGKTSTKDAIYEVIAASAYARKSEKSFNSEIGLPLTVLGRPNAWLNPIGWIENIFDGLILYLARQRYPEWLVLEVGADRPGDIRSLAAWLRVDVAVITRLPDVPVHVEFFKSPEAVKEEKASLINALKSGGALVLYADDPEVVALRERAPGAHIVTFGFSEAAMVRAQQVEILFDQERPAGMRAKINVEESEGVLEIRGAIGAHALLPALAAVGVGRALGKPLNAVLEALKHYDPPRGRMHLIEGEKNTVIIDDTYNSSPAAVHAALDTLALLPAKRKIAVLGDMLELGKHSVEEHRKAGARVAETAHMLLTVGFRARDIAQGALDRGMAENMIFQYEESGVAGRELERMLKEGDMVLVKGSQSIRTEKVVEEIMRDPAHAADLLVRQDEEWKQR